MARLRFACPPNWRETWLNSDKSGRRQKVLDVEGARQMTRTQHILDFGGGAGAWIFRILLAAAATFMVYTWFQPWWIADIAVIQGTDDLVLHPWGIAAVGQVRMGADPALYEMPGFFGPFVWTYFGAAMVALLASIITIIIIIIIIVIIIIWCFGLRVFLLQRHCLRIGIQLSLYLRD